MNRALGLGLEQTYLNCGIEALDLHNCRLPALYVGACCSSESRLPVANCGSIFLACAAGSKAGVHASCALMSANMSTTKTNLESDPTGAKAAAAVRAEGKGKLRG